MLGIKAMFDNFLYFVSVSIVCKHKILPARFHADSFSSPGHPLSYPSNYNCSWTLIAPEGYQVEIVFRAILTESCCDIIEVGELELHHDYKAFYKTFIMISFIISMSFNF